MFGFVGFFFFFLQLVKNRLKMIKHYKERKLKLRGGGNESPNEGDNTPVEERLVRGRGWDSDSGSER